MIILGIVALVIWMGCRALSAKIKEVALRKREPLPATGQATMADVERLAQAGQHIAAIRCYREIHQVGLAEAKRAVDDLSARN